MSATVSKLIQKRETDAAIQYVQLGRDGRESEPFWIPKSQIEHKSTMAGRVEIKIPEWLADSKGVDYYMAYLIEINLPYCGCGRKATVELCNQYNTRIGSYCRSCGRRRLKAHKESEKRELDERKRLH